MDVDQIMHPYQNPELPPVERTKDLLSRMTVEEKIGQLCKIRGFSAYERKGEHYEITTEFLDGMKKHPFGTVYGILRADWWTGRDWDTGVPPKNMRTAVNLFQKEAVENTRLGIPFLLVEEAPHGLMALGATVFPSGLGMGATWDSELLGRIGQVIGKECAAANIHSPYAPILDLAIDPRWSRVEECFSEDPYMVTMMGEAITRAILAEGITPTLKHFIANGASEGGHNAAISHIGQIELHNTHLRPFRNSIRAGAKALMSTYNEVDGMPCSGSHYLLTEILREKLGFDGFVTADAGVVYLMRSRRLAADDVESAAMALKAGVDGESGFSEISASGSLPAEAYTRGRLTDEDLDQAAGRILKVKFELGLFEHPYLDSPVELTLGCREHRDVALEAARKSMTLLKNNGILPLKNIGKLTVIGPNADNMMNMLGDYTAPQRHEDVVTVLRGVEAEANANGIEVSYAKGCKIRSRDKSGFAEAIDCAKNADAVILVLGGSSTKYGNVAIDPVTGATSVSIASNEESDKESGEGTDRATLCFSGVQLDLFRELKQTGKPVIAVLVQGRPLLVNELMDEADAVLLAWYPGMFGGQAVAETLFGKLNPAGRLPVSIPQNEGQLPVCYRTTQPRSPYIDSPGTPRLRFGYGLSYTTFAYDSLRIEEGNASVDVTNTGNMDGDEVVQFYLTDRVSSVLRPYRELCGFSRVHIARGETKTVTCELTDEVLGYYNQTLDHVVESGMFIIAAGGSLDSLLETKLLIAKI